MTADTGVTARLDAENAEYEILTRIGPGTPMGELLRRFWVPALLASEIAAPDSTPVRLRIMCEDLLAFRDSEGRVGIVDAYCRHRLAPLFFGRNEKCGIRCVYHGWKFDVNGNCTDLPNIDERESSQALLRKASIKAYPTREAGGLIWVYMGPKDKMPALPAFEWITAPPGHVHVARWLQRTNWAQGMEGEIDTSHISFLHSGLDPKDMPPVIRWAVDGAPQITLNETDYGYVYGARRSYENEYYWRITHWLLPMWSAIAGVPAPFSGQGRAWVPVDDYHVMSFGYNYRMDRPYTHQEWAEIESGVLFPPRTEYRPYELPDGYVIDAPIPIAARGNDYLIDRQTQRYRTYTGILGVNEQDRSLQENLPPRPGMPRGIVDRAREVLVKSDLPIVKARRRLISLAKALQEGKEPEVLQHQDQYGVRPISRLNSVATFDEFLKQYGEELKAPPPALAAE